MRILLVSTSDKGGGAERVAADLHMSLRRMGHDSRLLVKWKKTQLIEVHVLSRFANNSLWQSLLSATGQVIASRRYFRGQYSFQDALAALAVPRRIKHALEGRDNYHNLNCASLAAWPDGWKPDVVHLHNIHGGFFDLSTLSQLNQSAPIVATLHDTWFLAGHCGYFVDCAAWRKGCGGCPDLGRHPAIWRDRTAQNFIEKRRHLHACNNLHWVAPSQWLVDLILEAKLPGRSVCRIPYGIDLGTFHPGHIPKSTIRQKLGLPVDKFIVLASAAALSASNPYKDVRTILDTFRRLGATAAKFHCVILGRTSGIQSFAHITLAGFIHSDEVLADYYRAADVFVHAAHADNFPCTVLEAQACGTPVVATAVGGVAEQVIPNETGWLVERAASIEIQGRVEELATMNSLAVQSRIIANYAREKFDLTRHTQQHIDFYSTLA